MFKILYSSTYREMKEEIEILQNSLDEYSKLIDEIEEKDECEKLRNSYNKLQKDHYDTCIALMSKEKAVKELKENVNEAYEKLKDADIFRRKYIDEKDINRKLKEDNEVLAKIIAKLIVNS